MLWAESTLGQIIWHHTVFQLGLFPRAQRPSPIYMCPVPFINALSVSSSLVQLPVQLPVGLKWLRQLSAGFPFAWNNCTQFTTSKISMWDKGNKAGFRLDHPDASCSIGSIIGWCNKLMLLIGWGSLTFTDRSSDISLDAWGWSYIVRCSFANNN